MLPCSKIFRYWSNKALLVWKLRRAHCSAWKAPRVEARSAQNGSLMELVSAGNAGSIHRTARAAISTLSATRNWNLGGHLKTGQLGHLKTGQLSASRTAIT